MNEPNAILDTNTLILYEQLEGEMPSRPTITTITLAELSVGPLTATTDFDRAERLIHLQLAEADFDPLPFDAAAARVFGRVSADLRAAGRKTNARAYDALIAAIAISNELPLYTINPDDFEHITHLRLVPLAHPDV